MWKPHPINHIRYPAQETTPVNKVQPSSILAGPALASYPGSLIIAGEEKRA